MSICVTSSLALEAAVAASVDEDVAVAIEATFEAEGEDAAAISEGEGKAGSVVVVAGATAVILPMLATRTLSPLSVARSCDESIFTKPGFDRRAIT